MLWLTDYFNFLKSVALRLVKVSIKTPMEDLKSSSGKIIPVSKGCMFSDSPVCNWDVMDSDEPWKVRIS